MSSLLSLTFGFSWLVSLACEITLIVVVATVVRRHRPDAYGGLLGWAVASLVWSLVHQGLVTVAPMLLARDRGTEGLLSVHAGITVLGAIVHVVLFAVLLRALVKLAQPPRQAQVDPVGPYR